MDGSTVVFIVMPIVIPLVLAVGVVLPFIAARDTARRFSAARQLERTPQHPVPVVSSAAAPMRPAGARVRTYEDRSPLPVRYD
jgi:hypothetical protein